MNLSYGAAESRDGHYVYDPPAYVPREYRLPLDDGTALIREGFSAIPGYVLFHTADGRHVACPEHHVRWVQ